jgi:multidrug resistance efflux pump
MQVATARFASTSQAAIDSADANREVAINKAELELATAQYDYARDLMAKSVLSAPVDGIAVYSDRRDWQGRPVETGQQIMKIANPERIEFSIFLPVQDSLLIEDGARVKIYLDSDPLRPIDAQLLRAGYQAEKTENNNLAFRLVARADDGAALKNLRIGTRGTAQVYGGKVPLLFYVLRRPITVMRQTVGW